MEGAMNTTLGKETFSFKIDFSGAFSYTAPFYSRNRFSVNAERYSTFFLIQRESHEHSL